MPSNLTHMHNFRRQLLLRVFRLFDVAVVLLAIAAAALAANPGNPVHLAELLSMRVKVSNILILSGLLGCCHMIFCSFGYYRSRRLSSSSSEMLDIVTGTTAATAAVLAASVVFHVRLFNSAFMAAFFGITTCLILCSRLFLRSLLRHVRTRGRNLRNMLIVGTNDRALELARRVAAKPELGYRIVGFADEDWHGLSALGESGHSRVSSLDGLFGFIRSNVVDEVVIGLPVRSFHERSTEIATFCDGQGIIVRHLAYNASTAAAYAEDFDGDLLICHSRGGYDGWPIVVKRALDFSIALAALIASSPLLLVTAVAVKLTSPGPILFVHERMGLNKRKFKIYKFRTMVQDAEERMRQVEHLNEASGPVFKIRNDPRITLVGKFLRKTSVDELPQLLNVLKGDMSLVGPRPLPIRDYQGFNEDWHRRRFSMPPGITCLWQVEGRSSIPFNRWMELDLQYINEWSLWLDVKILLKTIPVVIKGSGAA